MNGISGKKLIAERQQRALLSIQTDENIVINNIVGADGSVTDSSGNVCIEVFFDIKAGYRFDPHVTTNTGVFIWDSIHGRFLGRKPTDTKLQISVSSVKQVIKTMRSRFFETEIGGQIYRSNTNAISVMYPLEDGERLPNDFDALNLSVAPNYCLNPTTGEIYFYNMPIVEPLSKPIVSLSGDILTFTPGEDWDEVGVIKIYESNRLLWNWRKTDLVNNTLNLRTCPDNVLSNGTHNFTVVYTDSSTGPVRDESPNSEVFEYTMSRTKLSTPIVSIEGTVVTFTQAIDWEHVDRIAISVDGEHKRVVGKQYLTVTDNAITMDLLRFITLTAGTHTIELAYDVEVGPVKDYYKSDLSDELTVTIGGNDE